MQLPQYPRYESYKSVKLELSQTIPKHWDVWKMAHAFEKIGSGTTPDTGRAAYYDGEISWLQTGDLTDGDVFSTNKTISPLALREYSTLKVYPTGSLVMAMYGATIGKLGKLGLSAATNQACCVFAESNVVTTQFAFYSLLAMRPFILSDAYGGGQPNISQQTIKEFRLVVPPLEEQQAIARFLDDKTDKIDRAVKIKEGQIALLRERKQIIIQEAVTKGLNPDAPMKDSGIDWIGQIPAHWEVEKLFGLCHFVRGNSAFSKDELLDYGDYVALQYGKTYKVDVIDSSYGFYVNEEFYKRSQAINFGDTIIISTSETIEDLGHSAVYNRDDVGLLGGEQILIKPISDLMDHLYTFYSTRAFLKELKKCATGVKVFRFNISDLKTIYTAVPPKDEQAVIASRIRSEMGKVDRAIELKERQIEALKEYKATLINAAVTGKIKVI